MNAIINAFSQTRCNKKVMQLRIIANRSGTSYGDALRDAKIAEAAGLGRIVIGRLGYKTRFETMVSNATFKRLFDEISKMEKSNG